MKIGLIINPFAGIGGSVALKGSDGEDIVEQAFALGATQKAEQKTQHCLQFIQKNLSDKQSIQWFCASGAMGETCLKQAGFNTKVIYQSPLISQQQDTVLCAQSLLQQQVDLIVFAGGDGTARDLCRSIAQQIPVIGIPCGVKIHSGVYATTVLDAARAVLTFIKAPLTEIVLQEVRDINEQAFRNNQLQSAYFGDLLCLQLPQYIQSVKMGGIESDALLNLDIADYLVEQLNDDTLYFIGSGKTLDCFMQKLGLNNSLLGVDAILNGDLIGKDLTAQQINQLAKLHNYKVIISVIGGQGHIFGRGNHQFDEHFLQNLNKEQLIVVANKRKLQQLPTQTLVIDSLDQQFINRLAGFLPVLCAYDQWIYCPVR